MNGGRTERETGRVRTGQAMVELIVGLIAVLVLFAGLLQVVSLTQARMDTLTNARREAGLRAMAAGANPIPSDPIRYWEDGPDASRYSADDSFTTADASAFRSRIVSRAAEPADWPLVDTAPQNALSSLRLSANPLTDFGFVNGTDSQTVPLIPTIRDFVYDADSITIESEVWMPWLGGMLGH